MIDPNALMAAMNTEPKVRGFCLDWIEKVVARATGTGEPNFGYNAKVFSYAGANYTTDPPEDTWAYLTWRNGTNGHIAFGHFIGGLWHQYDTDGNHGNVVNPWTYTSNFAGWRTTANSGYGDLYTLDSSTDSGSEIPLYKIGNYYLYGGIAGGMELRYKNPPDDVRLVMSNPFTRQEIWSNEIVNTALSDYGLTDDGKWIGGWESI